MLPSPRMVLCFLGHTCVEVIGMSTISPCVRNQFQSMPPELQQAVLALDVKVENLSDLMSCLERIIAEGETA